MKNSKKSTLLECVVYGIVMALTNLAGMLAMLLAIFLINVFVEQGFFLMEIFYNHYSIFLFLFIVITVAVPALLTRIYFKYKIPDIFPRMKENINTKKEMLNNFCFMVFPAEIFRFILSLLPTRPGPSLGYRFLDGYFTSTPNLIYDQLYISPNNRLPDIRETGYTFTDNAVFIIVYLVYFIAIIGILYLVFSQVWKKYEKDLKNEVKLHMDPEQMK